jgi:hypothetical protein
MSTQHTVKPGECLSSIARAYGFDDWKLIYNDAANATFKQNHPNPNVIYAGELLTIPDLDPGGKKAATDKKHSFQLKQDETLLRIIVQDIEDRVFAGKTFKLTAPPLAPITGKTGGDGLIETEIDPTLKSARLEVYIHGENDPPMIWDLLLGYLDPVTKTSGQQARLNNLAFESGPVDNIHGTITDGAIRRFQKKFGLQVDGIAGSKTRPKLEEVYGC